jgi:hypothetical protein
VKKALEDKQNLSKEDKKILLDALNNDYTKRDTAFHIVPKAQQQDIAQTSQRVK